MKGIFRYGLLSTLVFLSGCVAFEVGGEIQAGRRALLQGDHNVAVAHFRRAAQSDPDYLANFSPLQQGVWTYVGWAYYAMGKLPEARQALERARSRSETDLLARLYHGLTLMRQQKEQKTERPLSLDEIVFALREGVAPKRVTALIRERGIGFEPGRDGEKTLKMAGADDPLIEELRKATAVYANKEAAERAAGEQALKEVEAALRELHNWLESIPHSTTYGRFWDPGREIRSEIQANLATIAGGKVDFQKLLGGAEWVGMQLEQEIDRARRDEQEEIRRTIQRRR